MGDLKRYHVVFDKDENVVETKSVGVAEEVNRVVDVLAVSAKDARKKAAVLIGQKGGA